MSSRSHSKALVASIAMVGLPAFAATVGGIISTDTVWSDTSEAYTFSSAVQIKNGVTLTIDPGVNIEAGDIKVFGNLVVSGSANSIVKFTNVNVVPSGNGDPAKKFNIDISHASLTGGSLYYPTGNAIYGTLSLENSKLENLPYMYLWYPTSEVSIRGNTFLNFGGISVGSSNVNVLIENNLFASSSSFAVENWASYGTAMTTVRYNTFSQSASPAVRLPSAYNSAKMDARENYWGTTDVSVINSMIFDENDDLSSAGTIPFMPFLSSPHLGTPAISPVPEVSSWVMLLSGLAVVVTLHRRRKRGSTGIKPAQPLLLPDGSRPV